jgi:Ras-related protein Rab-32
MSQDTRDSAPVRPSAPVVHPLRQLIRSSFRTFFLSSVVTNVYYKYAIAAVVVFDLSRPATFDAVLKWKDDVNSKVVLANGQPIPAILLANKCDLEGVVLDSNMLDEFCEEHGFAGWFATSAADNKNVDEAMQFLVQRILAVAAENQVARPAGLDLRADPSASAQPESRGCCG